MTCSSSDAFDCSLDSSIGWKLHCCLQGYSTRADLINLPGLLHSTLGSVFHLGRALQSQTFRWIWSMVVVCYDLAVHIEYFQTSPIPRQCTPPRCASVAIVSGFPIPMSIIQKHIFAFLRQNLLHFYFSALD